jgi:NAD(P)-dependent dehydrogenase (short-subunit alcohol dehydrogenase family)
MGAASPQLQGQVAVVTGAGRGIGRAIATALAAHGASVAALARSEAEIVETVRLITAAGGTAAAFRTDVADPALVAVCFAMIESALGPIDLLVNNAGVLGPLGPFAETDIAEWWRTSEVNVLGPVLCSRAVLPGMIARRRGRIVTVASGAGANPMPPYFSAYVMSKTATVRFSECLAAEVKEQGIAVFAIGPGTVQTQMSEYSRDSPQGKRWLPWFGAIFDEGRDVPPERPADLVLSLATGKADALSGRYISIADDLDRMIAEAEKISREDLYAQRVQRLTG